MSSKLTVVLAVLLTVCVGLTYVGGRMRRAALERETQELLEECRGWELRLDELKKEMDAASTDEYVERAAREKLGLVKPGETLYIVTQPDVSGFVPVQKRPGKTIEIND